MNAADIKRRRLARIPGARLALACASVLIAGCLGGAHRGDSLPSPWDWESNAAQFSQPSSVSAPAMPMQDADLDLPPLPEQRPRYQADGRDYRTAAPRPLSSSQSLGIVIPTRPDQPVIYGVTQASPVDPRELNAGRNIRPGYAPPRGPQNPPAPAAVQHGAQTQDSIGNQPLPQQQTMPMPGNAIDNDQTLVWIPGQVRSGQSADQLEEQVSGLPSESFSRRDAGLVFPPPRVSQRPSNTPIDPYSSHQWRRPGSAPRPAVPNAGVSASREARESGYGLPTPARGDLGWGNAAETEWQDQAYPQELPLADRNLAYAVEPSYQSLAMGSGGAFMLGAGDVITISVYGRPELDTTAYVSERGKVQVPLAGEVMVAGLSPSRAATKIAEAYSSQELLLKPQVNVTVAEYRSQQISVIGEVRSPGRFPIETRMTVLDALALAGGLSELGGSSVQVLRPAGNSVVRYAVETDGFLPGDPTRGLFELRAGDTLVAPKAETFYIYGEVRQPNAYRLASNMTVVQALSLSGGLTERGTDKRIEIKRKSRDGQLASVAADLNTLVMPNDVIYVRERIF